MSVHTPKHVRSVPRSSLLHLRPRSAASQRVWFIGDERSIEPGLEVFRLAVLPDRHESFASLQSIIGQLRPVATPAQLAELDRVQAYIHEACPDFGRSSETHGRFLADSVTLAIMRRISRESVYTARVIDTGARVINSMLARVVEDGRVLVPDVDRLDRPTLKVLARAMLLLEPSHKFSWLWHLRTDPIAGTDFLRDDPYVTSRRDLLRKLTGILLPEIRHRDEHIPMRRPDGETQGAVSTMRLASALVVQNYDACFLWADALLSRADSSEVAECLRLRALAAVNVGMLDRALQDLRDAEAMTVLPGRRAHLCYLQGLIEAKRVYSLVKSDSHYQRGLGYLNGAGDQLGDAEDGPLERGWLLNGLALNEAILQRRDLKNQAHHARAVALEHEAFMLVRDGADGARAYLRFNLLANCALLMEMQNDYDRAIEIFTSTFDFTQSESPAIARRSRRTVGYRAGVLHYRAGRVEEAYRLLRDAAEQDATMDSWATHERILRALGCVALARGTPLDAADVFAQGLDICRGARSAEGTEDHARGLCAALREAGKERQAKAVIDMLSAEEDATRESIDHGHPGVSAAVGVLRPPSPKLPAYIPEIDLEGIPAIDINRYLGDAVGADTGQVVPWQA